MTAQLTKTQARVLAFMQQFFLQNDHLPSNEIIAEHFGWGSHNSAHGHVQALVKHDLLEKNSVGRWKFTDKARPEGRFERGPAWLPLPVVNLGHRQEGAHA